MSTTRVQFIKLFRIWGIVSLISLACIIACIDILTTYHNFRIHAETMRKDYIKQQEQMSKREVERVFGMINYEKGRTRALVKAKIKEQVYEAYSIARNIYGRNKGIMTDKEIKQMIIDAIRPIRYDRGMGYYFIMSLDGTDILLADRPEMEGRDMLGIHDSKGRYVVKDMISLVKDKGEGFYSYCWTRPNEKGNNHEKLSFVKLFKPFNWFIGTGFYIKDMENQIKQDLLERIGRIRFGKDNNGYIFVITYHGTMLMHDPQRNLIGKNVWNITDPNGVKVVHIERETVKKKAGDFIHYEWKKPSTGKITPKVTFIKGIDDWKWMIGSGVYLDDVEKSISILRSERNNLVTTKFFNFTLITLAVVVLFVFLFNGLSHRLKKDFDLFISFFNGAAFSDKKINRKTVKFREFYQMAGYANTMLENKIKAEQNLTDEKEQLAVTLRSIGDGVITTDISGRVELINTVAEKLTGWKQEDAVNKKLPRIFNIIDKEKRSSLENPVDMVLAHGNRVELDNNTVLISKDGTEYNISDSAAPIKDTKSNIRGVVLVFRDITERIRTEEELFKAEKLRSMGVFAGGIAHDFNNILTGIFGNIELAKFRVKQDKTAVRYIETAQSAMDRARSLTKQFLTFARGGDPILEAVNIKDIIEKSVKFNLAGSNVKAKIDVPDDIGQIKADRGQISEVISNLTINAKQAMPDGGVFYVRAENIKAEDIGPEKDKILEPLSGSYVKISLQDQGKGIARECMDKIFDPYFTTKKKGSGLGLAVVHSIIKKHNGYIRVDSSLQKGSIFTIYLPALIGLESIQNRYSAERKSIGDEFSIQDKSSIMAESITDALSGSRADKTITDKDLKFVSESHRRILIMDDEELIRDVSKDMLEALGYTAETSLDGMEAIKKYRAAQRNGNPFDIVIMDLTIPGGMGGKDAVKKLLDINPDAKVIVSSGYSTDPIMADYKKYGFKGRLVKPFQIQALKAEVKRVLEIS